MRNQNRQQVNREHKTNNSRTSVARILVARLPRLFQTCSCVPNQEHPIAADIIVFGIISSIFFMILILIMVCCVYSLESPHSNENTQHNFMLKKNRKDIPIMSPVLAL